MVIVEPVLAHLRNLDPGLGGAWPAGDGDRLPGGGSLSRAAEASERAGPLGPDPFTGDGCAGGSDARGRGSRTRRRRVPARVRFLQAGKRGVVAPLARVTAGQGHEVAGGRQPAPGGIGVLAVEVDQQPAKRPHVLGIVRDDL